MGRSFITKRQSGGHAARSEGEEGRQRGESLCMEMLPFAAKRKTGKNRFMSSQLPRAVNTSRAAASLLVSGAGTKFNDTIKKVEHTDGVGGCGAVTRIIWLDMTAHWKLIPTLPFATAPELFPDPGRDTQSRVGRYFGFKNNEKTESKGPLSW